jgi:mono/diheme cytochrome c family protein
VNRLLAGIVGAAALALAWAVPGYTQDAKVERGKQLYTEQKCKLCHSIEGVGNKKGPLDEVGGKLSAEEIKHWLVNPKEMAAKAKAERKPPMKAFDKLPAADLDALVAYIQTLKN